MSTFESPPPKDTFSTGPTYSTQILSHTELRILSQIKGTKHSIDRDKNYVYRPDVNEKTFIYHAEIGISKHHIGFKQREIEGLYVGYCSAYWIARSSERKSRILKDHNICTAFKAAGSIYGVAKAATLVVVKKPDSSYASL